MGLLKKSQGDGAFGLSIRSLKPINTKPTRDRINEEDGEDGESCSTTPTAKEARIPEREQCPPAPRKPRPSGCNYHGNREFFSPPDLETVFVLRVDKSN